MIGIGWELGWLSSGDIVYFVLFKEYIWGLIQLFDDQVLHITANCNESHIKLLETCYCCGMVLPFMLYTTLIDITGRKV